MQENLFPFEFSVPGTPISLQASAKSKAIWAEAVSVRAVARRDMVFPMAFLDRRPLAVTLFYFPADPMQGDLDNIVKPILDAMCRIVYPDDRLIERVVVQKFEPQIVRTFESPSEQLATVLDMAPPMIYIRVDDDLEWRTVP